MSKSLSSNHIKFLSSAFETVAGHPEEGKVCFVRCLSEPVITALIESVGFTVPDWNVFAVCENAFGNRYITAGRAVDIREEKKGATLLLVIPGNVGAGMDGIYSATLEIAENTLFRVLQELTHRQLGKNNPGIRDFARSAVVRAKKLGRGNVISPWEEFDFYVQCCDLESEAGAALPLLGLWPVGKEQQLNEIAIDISARMVERVLLEQRNSVAISQRCTDILDDKELAVSLEGFLRLNTAGHWRHTVTKLIERPDLWIGSLVPIFARGSVCEIEIRPWWPKVTKDSLPKPHKWSGLEVRNDEVVFIIDQEGKNKLTVQWSVKPEELPAGTAEYKVTILSSDESEILSQTIRHSGKKYEKAIFHADDFSDFDREQDSWDAHIRVSLLSDQNDPSVPGLVKDTDVFYLKFGEASQVRSSVAGRKVRSLIEGAIECDKDTFPIALVNRAEDRKNFVSFKAGGKSAQVFRPAMMKYCEEDWKVHGFVPGRWIAVVDQSGRCIEKTFMPLQKKSPCFDEVVKISAELGEVVLSCGGFCGMIYGPNDPLPAKYIEAWLKLCEQVGHEASMCNSIEIQSRAGDIIGVLVLPSHPLRVAWHLAYDRLGHYLRYHENLEPARALRVLKSLDGSYCPFILPGLKPGVDFVFAEVLNFFFIAMVPLGHDEPQVAVAQMANALSEGKLDIERSISANISKGIANDVSRYWKIHPEYRQLIVNALRPGDGRALVKGLGEAFRNGLVGEENIGFIAEDISSDPRSRSFFIRLYPSDLTRELGSEVVGKFLSESTERRRTGAGSIPEEDRWMRENISAPGGQAIPRLSWARKNQIIPDSDSHISIAFDLFSPRITMVPINDAQTTGEGMHSRELFGLAPSMLRLFQFQEQKATWRMTAQLSMFGEKHPADPILTDFITRTKRMLSNIIVIRQGLDPSKFWPALDTEIKDGLSETLRVLHERSDWVISIGKQGGLEYFDSPRDAEELYEAYVIDAVPEREDLGLVQLITSTSNLDEVLSVIEQTVSGMGLSCSSRNARYVLRNLKALSGRLAMRSAGSGRGQELVALASLYGACRAADVNDNDWLSPKKGFFVPIDDIQDLHSADQKTEMPQSRADLVYVCPGPGRSIRFVFVEVKFRHAIKTARSSELLSQICNQLRTYKDRWYNDFFPEKVSTIERLVFHGRLTQTLSFYLEKGRRHDLTLEAYTDLKQRIEDLFSSQAEVCPESWEMRGYIFSPEHETACEYISEINDCDIYLFGPLDYPVVATTVERDFSVKDKFTPSSVSVPSQSTELQTSEQGKLIRESLKDSVEGMDNQRTSLKDVRPHSEEERVPQNHASVHEEIILPIGRSDRSKRIITWSPSVRGNPHLLVVGLSGTGKSVFLKRTCIGLFNLRIVPIVFDFHGDLEAHLVEAFPNTSVIKLSGGPGFNPMRVVGNTNTAWLDNIGRLRDIFAGIFPDLGDIQLNQIREAIKKSYRDLGYGNDLSSNEVPEFQSVFENLKTGHRTDPKILMRLEELNDYSFFAKESESASLLDLPGPVVIDLHSIQNEILQRALASFALFNLYQAMFIRGESSHISHMIIFDEAHRSSKLKLVSAMAKEARKYGLAIIVASQEVKDFDSSVFANVANHLILKLHDTDAKIMAKHLPGGGDGREMIERIKRLPKFHGIFSQGDTRPELLQLFATEENVLEEPDI